MTAPITLELTEAEALAVLYALRKVRPNYGKAVADRVKAQLPNRPLIARCPHCQAPFTVQPELADHLAEAHRYPTDQDCWDRGEKPEDTAETNAWDAFQRAKEQAK